MIRGEPIQITKSLLFTMNCSNSPVRRRAYRASLLIALLMTPSGIAAAEQLNAGGMGAGLAVVRIFGEQVTAAHPDVQINVLPSLGTPGGIKALSQGAVDIAIAARQPNAAPLDSGLSEAACATTALVFASSRAQPSGITRAQLPALYANPAPTWPDGTPLKIILRSRTGSENPFLINAVPGIEAAFAVAYQRQGMPIGATDQENAEIAQRTAGSLAVTTLLQIRTEQLKLHPVPLDGVAPGPDTIAAGRYPMPFRICLLLRSQASSGATRFIAYVRSPAGRALWRDYGAEPSN